MGQRSSKLASLVPRAAGALHPNDAEAQAQVDCFHPSSETPYHCVHPHGHSYQGSHATAGAGAVA